MNSNTPFSSRQLQEYAINHTNNFFGFHKETVPYKQ